MVYIAVLEAVPERVASSNLATRTKFIPQNASMDKRVTVNH